MNDDRPEPAGGFWLPRGPTEEPGFGLPSWDSEELPVIAEQRLGLAAAERDACYRWAAQWAEGRRVLDVDCGDGTGAGILAAAGAKSVLGIDARAEAVAAARSRHGGSVEFVEAEPLGASLEAGRFDLITCLWALVRAEEPDRLLERLAGLLSGSGLLVAALPLAAPRDPISDRELYESRDAEQWERALGARFDRASLCRLRLSFAAVVGLDPGEERATIPAEGIHWLGADPGEDRALLAIVGATAPPDAKTRVTMVGSRDLREYRDTVSAWEQRARRAEAEGAAKHWELVASREAQRRLRKRLHVLEHRPLRRLSRLIRGKPWKVGPGPPIRAAEREPEPWD